MRLLLDTHTFIWQVRDDERLPATTSALIAAADLVALSVASVWEGEIKRAAGRLDAPALAEAAESVGVALLAITAEHATRAAHLPFHNDDPFDRLLVAQAQAESLVLVTKDAILGRYGIAVAW